MVDLWRLCEHFRLYTSRLLLESTQQGLVYYLVQQVHLGIRDYWNSIGRGHPYIACADDNDPADVYTEQGPRDRNLSLGRLVNLPD